MSAQTECPSDKFVTMVRLTPADRGKFSLRPVSVCGVEDAKHAPRELAEEKVVTNLGGFRGYQVFRGSHGMIGRIDLYANGQEEPMTVFGGGASAKDTDLRPMDRVVYPHGALATKVLYKTKTLGSQTYIEDMSMEFKQASMGSRDLDESTQIILYIAGAVVIVAAIWGYSAYKQKKKSSS